MTERGNQYLLRRIDLDIGVRKVLLQVINDLLDPDNHKNPHDLAILKAERRELETILEAIKYFGSYKTDN